MRVASLSLHHHYVILVPPTSASFDQRGQHQLGVPPRLRCASVGMQKICMFVGIATASAFGSSGSKVQLSPYRKSGNQYLRSPAVTLEDRSTLYDEYMRSREEYLAATGQAVAPPRMPQRSDPS